MTPSPDVDEIASALIDGALGPDEAAAARRDPAVAARAAELQAAREAVRRVPPPDPARREGAIAAALAAADELPRPVPGYDVSGDPGASGGLDDAPAGGGPDSGPRVGPAASPIPPSPPTPASPAGRPAGGGRVVPMGPARRRRWTDPRWLGAAAAVVLVLAVGGVVATRSSSDSDSDQATAAMDSAPSTTGESAPQDGDAGGGTGSAEGGGSSTASPELTPDAAPDQSSGAPSPTRADLGDVDSAAELADRAGHALAATNRSSADAEANADDLGPPADEDESSGSGSGPLTASEACPDPLVSTGAGPLVLQGRATLAGRPVDVWVHDNGTSRRMVAVASDGSCDVVADRPVPG